MPLPTPFHDPTSEPSRSVHWFALETGIELELELTWLTRGDHRFISWHHTNTRKSITLDYALPVLLMPAYKGDAAPGMGGRCLFTLCLRNNTNADLPHCDRGGVPGLF